MQIMPQEMFGKRIQQGQLPSEIPGLNVQTNEYSSIDTALVELGLVESKSEPNA